MYKLDLPKTFLKLVNCKKYVYTVVLDFGVMTAAVVMIAWTTRPEHTMCQAVC